MDYRDYIERNTNSFFILNHRRFASGIKQIFSFIITTNDVTIEMNNLNAPITIAFSAKQKFYPDSLFETKRLTIATLENADDVEDFYQRLGEHVFSKRGDEVLGQGDYDILPLD